MTLVSAEDNLVLNVLPVGLQNSAFVLDDDGSSSSSVTDLEELCNSNESNLTPAAVNIENSSDVIIGPVFNGPVTIYQNVNGTPAKSVQDNSGQNGLNGKLVKSESTSSDTPHASEKPAKSFLSYSKRFKYLAISVVLFIIISFVTTVTIFSLKSSGGASHPPDHQIDPTDGDGDDNTTIGDDDGVKPTGPGAIIGKKLWGGREPLNFTLLKHPTHLVIVAHTATPQCKTFTACCERVRNIQSGHVAENDYTDISYNFLIGADGNAYVGRGWDVKNANRNDSISISFIGNYIFESLTSDMIAVAQKLLKEGVKTGKLAKDYKLIGHNQTFNTLSPGKNVYSIIKTWTHFDGRDYFETDRLR